MDVVSGFGALCGLLEVREGIIVHTIVCARSSPVIMTLTNIPLILPFSFIYPYIFEIQKLTFQKIQANKL